MRILCVFALISSSVSAFAQVTTQTILNELKDFSHLYQRRQLDYKLIQHSSYDRKSLTAGNDAWFANADYGQYIRDEVNEGRIEHVMCETFGPGAVVRFWSANPTGIVRLYFDGSKTAKITAPLADFLSGKVSPFESFAYESARGWNNYCPMPFAKSLKVTVETPGSEDFKRIYYHVDFRIYRPLTDVQTFDPKRPVSFPQYKHPTPSTVIFDGKLPARLAVPMHVMGASVVNAFRITLPGLKAAKKDALWSDPKQLHNLLRNLVVEMAFDGRKTVSVPLPDLFGCPPAVSNYETMMCTVKGDEFTLYFPMPFRDTATFSIINYNKFDVQAKVAVHSDSGGFSLVNFDYYFHAQWTPYKGSTRPMVDMNGLDTKGYGNYVGTVLHVANSVNGWWGEGDEKIFVDGEKFPSSFGTGTEDYFSYAWSNPEVYQRPFHAQPRADGPANRGQIANLRWHVLDCIPFTRSINFSLEKWHWQDCICDFALTSFWYGNGTQPPRRVSQKDLLPIETAPPAPVKGALEGETLEIVNKNGGVTEKQGGFGEMSGDAQLWWRDAKPGNSLTLKFPVNKTGNYEISGKFCMASDYGNHRISINGKDLGIFKFWSKDLKWQIVKLGKVELTKGFTTIVVSVDSTNETIKPNRYMFGLDYLMLKPGK